MNGLEDEEVELTVGLGSNGVRMWDNKLYLNCKKTKTCRENFIHSNNQYVIPQKIPWQIVASVSSQSRWCYSKCI